MEDFKLPANYYDPPDAPDHHHLCDSLTERPGFRPVCNCAELDAADEACRADDNLKDDKERSIAI